MCFQGQRMEMIVVNGKIKHRVFRFVLNKQTKLTNISLFSFFNIIVAE
jgi:hypothetical protein